MWTILDKLTGRVLFAKFDNKVLGGQVAINQICDLEIQEGEEIYWDFKNEIFYTK